MYISLDLSFNCNKFNLSSVTNLFSSLLKNIDFVTTYENFEFDIISKKIQRTNKVVTFIFSTEEENDDLNKEFWNFIIQIKKIRGLFIESICDLNTDKLLFATKYYKKYISVFKGERKTGRNFSEKDTSILENVLRQK